MRIREQADNMRITVSRSASYGPLSSLPVLILISPAYMTDPLPSTLQPTIITTLLIPRIHRRQRINLLIHHNQLSRMHHKLRPSRPHSSLRQRRQHEPTGICSLPVYRSKGRMFVPSPMVIPPICHFEGGVVAMTGPVPLPRGTCLATAGAAAE